MEANFRSHPDEQQDQLRSPIRILREYLWLYKAPLCLFVVYLFTFLKRMHMQKIFKSRLCQMRIYYGAKWSIV